MFCKANLQKALSISVIKTNHLMFCKAKLAVCSEIHINHTNSCGHNVEFLNVKTCVT